MVLNEITSAICMEKWTRWNTNFIWCHKLYPSIPIDKVIDLILQQLSEDYEDLKTRMKPTLVNIQQQIEVCVSECYFLWDNVIWNLLNSGAIGLSILVVLSETYLQNFEKIECLECHEQFNWINPKALSTEQQYHRQKIRESLEIKRAKTNKRRKVLNRDERNIVKTNTWTPLFAN